MFRRGPGSGSLILGQVNVGGRVGEFVYVHGTAILDYDSVVGDFCFIGPRFCCGGDVRIGRRCCFGLRVTVAPGLVIGDDVTAGAGSVITRDVGPGLYVSGNPAVVRGPTNWDRW
jgi:acetyltransferase EpsM